MVMYIKLMNVLDSLVARFVSLFISFKSCLPISIITIGSSFDDVDEYHG